MEWNNEEALTYLKKLCFPRKTGTTSLINARDNIFKMFEKKVKNANIEEFHFKNELNTVVFIIGSIAVLLSLFKITFWTHLFWVSILFSISQMIFIIIGFFIVGPYLAQKFFNNRGSIQGYNIKGIIPAKKIEKQILILGAHYDSKSTLQIRYKIYFLLLISLLFSNISIIVYGIIRFFSGSSVWWFSLGLNILVSTEIVCFLIYMITSVVITNNSPGANDNASGVATLLEIASIFSLNNPMYITLIFSFFDAEELGFQGSSAFVNQHIEEFINKNVWMINLDMVAGKNPLNIITRGGIPTINHGKKILPAMKLALNKLVEKDYFEKDKFIKMNARNLMLESDYVPFLFKKIPTIFCFSKSNYHSKKDNWANINSKLLSINGKLIEQLIKNLDNSYINNTNLNYSKSNLS